MNDKGTPTDAKLCTRVHDRRHEPLANVPIGARDRPGQRDRGWNDGWWARGIATETRGDTQRPLQGWNDGWWARGIATGNKKAQINSI
jgi:hypothetical protein